MKFYLRELLVSFPVEYKNKVLNFFFSLKNISLLSTNIIKTNLSTQKLHAFFLVYSKNKRYLKLQFDILIIFNIYNLCYL